MSTLAEKWEEYRVDMELSGADQYSIQKAWAAFYAGAEAANDITGLKPYKELRSLKELQKRVVEKIEAEIAAFKKGTR